MNWQSYFLENTGNGFLATASRAGEVNIAPYLRPEVQDDGTLLFGMSDGRTYRYVSENPHAVYAFDEGGSKGVRVYLERVQEWSDGMLLEKLRRRADAEVRPGSGRSIVHVVAFRVERFEPLTRT
jgi:hypothetical protein